MSERALEGLAVVVVNFGRPDLLRQHLLVVARDVAPARAVVVDNFSTAQARSEVQALCEAEGWLGVYPDGNTGFGTGCNLGAQAALEAGAVRLLFLNPDATVDRRSAQLLADACAQGGGLVAPTVLRPDGTVASAGMDLDLRSGEMRPSRRRGEHPGAELLPWLSGSCLMLDATLWTRIGGFDDDYFLYWEDVDLCARAHAHGAPVVLVEGATATHEGGRTHTGAGSRAKSATYYYFNIRNRQLFARKWLSEERQRHWLRTSPAAAYEILMRGGRRQFRRPVAPLSAALRGLRDGARSQPGSQPLGGVPLRLGISGDAGTALRSSS